MQMEVMIKDFCEVNMDLLDWYISIKLQVIIKF